MWESNQAVRYIYTTTGAQQVWAIFDGLTGWKQVQTGAPDGVGNIAQVLTTAKTRGRKVNVFLQNDRIERALML